MEKKEVVIEAEARKQTDSDLLHRLMRKCAKHAPKEPPTRQNEHHLCSDRNLQQEERRRLVSFCGKNTL